jgi:hypothetical protein
MAFSHNAICLVALMVLITIFLGFFTMVYEHSITSRRQTMSMRNDILVHINDHHDNQKRRNITDFWKRPGGPTRIHHCKSLSDKHPAIYANTRFAVVSMLTSDNSRFYTLSAIKLAKSLRWWFPPEKMDLVMMVTDGFGISTHIDSDFYFTVMELENAGWNLICKMPVIEPASLVNKNRFHDIKVYSKLNVWALTEYDAILFLDSDTLVIRDLEKLFTAHFPAMERDGMVLGAVRDRPESLSHGFNAGVLVIIPRLPRKNSMDFPKLVQSIVTVPHDEGWAEQGLLNVIFKDNYYELPFVYNANLVSKLGEIELWDRHKEEIAILHYTVSKGWMSIRHSTFYIEDGLWGLKSFCCWLYDTDDLCQLWDGI